MLISHPSKPWYLAMHTSWSATCKCEQMTSLLPTVWCFDLGVLHVSTSYTSSGVPCAPQNQASTPQICPNLIELMAKHSSYHCCTAQQHGTCRDSCKQGHLSFLQATSFFLASKDIFPSCKQGHISFLQARTSATDCSSWQCKTLTAPDKITIIRFFYK